MRHRFLGRKLNRKSDQRRALFLSLARSLIENGQMKTTLVKAKVIRRIVEKQITKAKKRDLTGRRKIQTFLRSKKHTNRLVDVIAPLFSERSGGYLRIIPLPQREGDNAKMAKVEFVEEILEKTPDEKKKEEKLGIKKEENLKTEKQKNKKERIKIKK